MEYIENKKLNQNNIIRTLVTLLIVKFGSATTRNQCELAGKNLLLQYPHMKDDIGNRYVSNVLIALFNTYGVLSNGFYHFFISYCICFLNLQTSWADKMVERIQNLNKLSTKKNRVVDKNESPPPPNKN